MKAENREKEVLNPSTLQNSWAVEALARKLMNNGRMCGSELSLVTGIPSWKISHMPHCVELLGPMHSTSELRFERGRPRKCFELTEEGRRFFSRTAEG